MPTRKPLPLDERARIMLQNRHAAYVDLVEEYTPYVKLYPHDAWARGTLDYAQKEVKRLAELLALHENRQTRPV